jgi:hypothetical protein
MSDMDEIPETTDGTETEPVKKECAFCEKVAAVLGLFIGGFVAFVGIDLLTKGRLSRMVNRSGNATEDEDE